MSDRGMIGPDPYPFAVSIFNRHLTRRIDDALGGEFIRSANDGARFTGFPDWCGGDQYAPVQLARPSVVRS